MDSTSRRAKAPIQSIQRVLQRFYRGVAVQIRSVEQFPQVLNRMEAAGKVRFNHG
jgi:hypothetical protein